MKFLLLVALCVVSCCAQAVRFDPQPSTTITSYGNVPYGYPQVLAIPSATVSLCGYPANGFPCTNLATSYTDATAATQCASSNPVVLAASATCTNASDGQGNFGFWVMPGNYAYMLTIKGITYGPYPFTAAQGPFDGGNVVGNSLTIGGASVSTPSTISLITPTLTGVTDMFRLALNTCPSSLEYGNGSIPILQGIVGCTRAPDNSNLGGVSTGGSFYSFGGGGIANTPVVGAFVFGAPGGASNAYIGSLNGAVTNATMGTGAGLPVSLFASELDINTASSGSAPFLAHGLAVVSAATQVPTNAFDALDCRISIGISLPFNQCLVSEPGAATEGLRFWPLASTASNSASQPIVLVARNSAGAYSTSKFYLDPAGTFQFFTGGGNFVLNPAVTTNSSSPELTFSSYSSGGTLQQGGMFLDSFGNMNLKPSTTAFAQTSFLNGSGQTIAEVDTAAFRIDPTATDPGCTASQQIGSWWIDTATSTTVVKICKSVSGTIGWSTITTSP